ncbi:MAG: hypothetical protein SPF89_06665 [Sphaerochaetaceae bacterium]|nr:hypothetical protein [Spirochaetales bacterium]MDY5499768.1 hypothetical protein [Sphaerochaetaceae bacterium]
MRRPTLRWSTLVLATLNLVLVVLLWLPKQVDASLIPNVASMEGHTFKAETSGGKETLSEIGTFVTHLAVRDNLVWLYGDDAIPSLWDWRTDRRQGCLLSQNGQEPSLRLENHGAYLSLSGLASGSTVYFVERR